MASRKKTPGNTNRPKRTTATIDLKAKEITASNPGAGPDTPKASEAVAPGTAKDGPPAAKGKDDPSPAQTAAAAVASEPAGKPGKPQAGNADQGKPGAAAGTDPKSHSSKSGSPGPVTGKPASPRPTGTVTGKPAGATAGAGFLGHAAAGLVGAVLALIGASFFFSGPPDGASKTEAEMTALAKRLQAVETRAAKPADAGSLSGELATRLGAVDQRLTRLEDVNDTIARLSQAQQKLAADTAELKAGIAGRLSGAAADGPDRAGMLARLTKLEDALSAMSDLTAAAEPGTLAEVASLNGKINDFAVQLDTRLEALEKKLDGELAAKVADVDARLEQSRLAEAKSTEAVETLKAGTKRLGREMEAVKTEAARLAKRLDTVRAGGENLAGSLEALEAKLAQVARSLQTFRKTVDARLGERPDAKAVAARLAPLDQRLTGIEKRVARVMSREENRQKSTGQIVLALELSNLKRALERGEPVAPALAKVAKVAPPDLDLSALEEYGAKEVATTAELLRKFRGVTRAVLDADRKSDGGSVLDQILTGARSIVRIRRTGNISGNTAEAIMARAEERLKHDDLEGARLEARKLTGNALEAAGPWLGQLEARLAVDRAIARIDDQLKAALAGAPTN